MFHTNNTSNRYSIPEDDFDNDSFITASNNFNSDRSFYFSLDEAEIMPQSKHVARRKSLENTNGGTPSDLYLLFLQRRQIQDDDDLSYITDYESEDEIRKAKEDLCRKFPSKSLRYKREKVTNRASNLIECKNFEAVQIVSDGEQDDDSFLPFINPPNNMIHNMECASTSTCDSSYLLNNNGTCDDGDISCTSYDGFNDDNDYPLVLPSFDRESRCWELRRTTHLKSKTVENHQLQEFGSDLSTDDETLSSTNAM